MAINTSSDRPYKIPARAGIGLRAAHYGEVLKQRPAVGWLEVHSENFFGDGGEHLYFLEQIRAHYPLSLHGVGLSLGSTDAFDDIHLTKLKRLIQRFQPALVSEHVCWGSVGDRHLNDLLPLPYTEEALEHMVDRVSQVQDILGRQILIENVSSYLEFAVSDIPEWEFVAAIAQRTGCGILLDVNNIYVNARNHNFAAELYLDAIPAQHVQEIHLAGFSVNTVDNTEILIDTHSRPVADAVWALYQQTLQRFGQVPTLIEWDLDLPPLAILLAQAQRADAIANEQHAITA